MFAYYICVIMDLVSYNPKWAPLAVADDRKSVRKKTHSTRSLVAHSRKLAVSCVCVGLAA